MRILDRYILKSTASLFIGTQSLFFLLYIAIDILSHLDEILKQGMNPPLLLQYYASYLPVIFIQTSPIACLLAVLYTFGRLNRSHEIVAMRASGLSLWQICRSTVFFGCVISAFVFMANERLVPNARETTEQIKRQMEYSSADRNKKRSRPEINNLSIYGLRNRLFFIKSFDTQSNTIENVTILEQDKNQNITSKILADKGVWKDKYWNLYKCTIFYFDSRGIVKGNPEFHAEIAMYLDETPKDFIEQRQRPEHMNMARLNNYIRKISKSGAKTVIRNLQVDLFYKTSFPFTSLVIILLGIPFSLEIKKRGAALSSIGICMIIAFLYYVMDAVSIALGKSGLLPPLLAAWTTNIIFLYIALFKFQDTL
ncbi:MAG: LPS export ABC transporter permease LptG [Candidatus Omnitrophica bacterium]|nr:LPS export ABC transporter permease LptG [Candidatus Omnitrophota bacterium]